MDDGDELDGADFTVDCAYCGERLADSVDDVHARLIEGLLHVFRMHLDDVPPEFFADVVDMTTIEGDA